MNDAIVFRPYQPSDRQALSAIIRDTWQYDRFASAKTAARMARLYLNSCLTNQTFTQVAVLNGSPVGIIMAQNRHAHHRTMRQRLHYLRALLPVLCSQEGRDILQMFTDIHRLDQVLLEDSASDYDGEIVFFAIDNRVRGKGLGRRLFNTALDELRACGMHSFFLFTDTSCNYAFYEHLGLTRRCQCTKTLNVQDSRAIMTFFLYDYHF